LSKRWIEGKNENTLAPVRCARLRGREAFILDIEAAFGQISKNSAEVFVSNEI